MKTSRAITIHFKDLHVRYQKREREKEKEGKEDRDKIERRKACDL